MKTLWGRSGVGLPQEKFRYLRIAKRMILVWWGLVFHSVSDPDWFRLRVWSMVVWMAAAIVFVTAYRPRSDPTPAVHQGEVDVPLAAQSPGGLIIDHLGRVDILDRSTLFRRRKRERKPVAPVKNVTIREMSKNLHLQGVLGNGTLAVLFDRASRKTVHVSAGQFVGALEVKEVRKRSVVLTWEGEVVELVL